MINKGIYKAYCEQHKERIPLFHNPFWLDLMSGAENWDAIVIQGKDKQVELVWPYVKSTQKGISKISQPLFTPYLGPIIHYPHNIEKRERKYSFLIKTLTSGIEALPKSTVFKQGLHPDIDNWTPFYWKGFRQSTKYTYQINNIKDKENTWNEYKSNLKNQIRSAKKLYQVTKEDKVDSLYQLNQKTYNRKGVKIELTSSNIAAIYKALRENYHADILTVRDENEQAICSCLIAYDATTAYVLLIGVDKETKPKGAVQLMLAEAISVAAERVDVFDFEGSMIQDVEPVFRVFGGERKPYSVVTRAPGWFRIIHEIIKRKDFTL